MGQVEELPDDFDESMNLNDQPPTVSEGTPEKLADKPPAAIDEPPFPINEEKLKELEKNDPAAPKMPPSMASVKTHSTEELWDMMNKTPLFMTDIDKAGDERAFSCFPRQMLISELTVLFMQKARMFY